jgi:hypothetical protein
LERVAAAHLFLYVLVLVVALKRAFEVSNAFAQSPGEIRQLFAPEQQQKNNDNDKPLKGADGA